MIVIKFCQVSCYFVFDPKFFSALFFHIPSICVIFFKWETKSRAHTEQQVKIIVLYITFMIANKKTKYSELNGRKHTSSLNSSYFILFIFSAISIIGGSSGQYSIVGLYRKISSWPYIELFASPQYMLCKERHCVCVYSGAQGNFI